MVFWSLQIAQTLWYTFPFIASVALVLHDLLNASPTVVRAGLGVAIVLGIGTSVYSYRRREGWAFKVVLNYRSAGTTARRLSP